MPKDCAVCYGPCDPAIHAATERLHKWWRDSLNQKLAVPEAPKIDKHSPRKFDAPAPNKLGKITAETVGRLRESGMTQKAIAKACGCGINTVRLRIEQWAGEQDRARTGAA